jgi:hypothetical protein
MPKDSVSKFDDPPGASTTLSISPFRGGSVGHRDPAAADSAASQFMRHSTLKYQIPTFCCRSRQSLAFSASKSILSLSLATRSHS